MKKAGGFDLPDQSHDAWRTFFSSPWKNDLPLVKHKFYFVQLAKNDKYTIIFSIACETLIIQFNVRC